MSSWTAASSDCSRPVNNYVHVKTADLYRPNARLTPERQGYQVLTPFGKLGYSHFDQSAELKGVFKLGKRNVDAVKKIVAAKNELDALTKEIEALTLNLQGEDGEGGKKGDLVALEEWLKKRCWEQKQKHDAKLSGAFEGFRGSLEKFKKKSHCCPKRDRLSLVTR